MNNESSVTSPYSHEFLEWAHLAGWSLDVSGSVWELGDLGFEDRYYLRFSDGLYTLSKASRGERESFIVRVSSINHIERYLTVILGPTIRREHNLQMMNGAGVTPVGLCPGWSLKGLADRMVALIGIDGQIRAIMHGDTYTSAGDATRFSWIADASLDDLRASYLDPDGLPLFPGCRLIQDDAVYAAVMAQRDTWGRGNPSAGSGGTASA